MFVLTLAGIAAAIGLASAADLSTLNTSTFDSQSIVVSNNGRIVGGNATTIDRYPYTAQVITLRNYLCGGSLISRRHVLTAAHCFDIPQATVRPSDVSVRVGTTFLESGGNTHSVSTIFMHPNYNVPMMDNDVAVLALTSQVTLNPNVQTIPLPPQGWALPDNLTVTHVGWGVLFDNSVTPSLVLQDVHIQSINRQICRQRYNQLPQTIPNLITENMICAGILDVGGKDACQGDSGGPLIYNGTVVGITSFGVSCAHPFYPGVSARVSSYTNWITNIVNAGYTSAHSLSGILLILSLITGLMTAVN